MPKTRKRKLKQSWRSKKVEKNIKLTGVTGRDYSTEKGKNRITIRLEK